MSKILDPRLKKLIPQIATTTMVSGGAAFELNSCQFLPPLDLWSFPKYPGRTAILPGDTNLVAALENFITANEQFLREPDCWMGTWIHPQTGEFYLDISTGCSDLESAKKLALESSQRDGRRVVALYNSCQKVTIYL